MILPTATLNERQTLNLVSGEYNGDGTAANQLPDDHWNTTWVPTLDKDFDPMYGDLGKVDNDNDETSNAVGGDDMADNFDEDDDSNACTADDGGTAHGSTSSGAAINNGTLCDAEDVEIETSVKFPLGLGYGCDPVTVDYTLTCQWDSRGNRTNAIPVPTDPIALPSATDGTNIGDFVTCKVEKN